MRRPRFTAARGLLLGLALATTGAVALAQAPPADPRAQQASATAAPVAAQPPVATEDAASPARAKGPLQHELSPWSMFLSADTVVKAVMIGLACASVATWTVFLAKSLELLVASLRLKGALRRIAKSATLSQAQIALGAREGPLSLLLRAAAQEIEMARDIRVDDSVRERAASHFSEIVRSEGRSIRRGMGLLATIGATSGCSAPSGAS